MAEIRITGLVRLMRWARAQLEAGIPPEQAQPFRQVIQKALAQLDGALRDHRATPASLTRPSREAYAFLKGIDLQRLPARQPARARVKNTPLTLSQAVLEEMTARLPALRGPDRAPAEEQLYQKILAAGEAARKCLTPASGAPTRRAAAWLELLEDRATLTRHLDALLKADRLARERLRSGRSARVMFYHTASLYRTTAKAGEIELIAHEGFIAASESVLEALVRLAVSRRSRRWLQQVRTFTASQEFLGISQRLAALATGKESGQAQGRHYSLEQAFERVNRDLFQSGMPRPRLTWSRGETYREFGHYQPSSDTVSISRSLDSAQVPEFVLDYVVFHELLHKQMGMKLASGRLYSHTPAFRRAERTFPRYAEAKAYLQELSVRLSPRRRGGMQRAFKA